MEVHHTDLRKEIYFPDGTVKNILPEGVEETFFKDGIYQKVDNASKQKTIQYPNGQIVFHIIKEVFNNDGSRIRKCPDGKVRKINADGIVSDY